jgi:acetylglutamate kinase
MNEIAVVKIGGKLIENEFLLNDFLEKFSMLKIPKILIHGGGQKATKLSKKLNVNVKIINGRRVTDKKNLKIATMVYAGELNKKIVSKLQKLNCNSIGLSGADGNSIVSKKRENKKINYGFVGDITYVNTKFILELINNNLTPVFCAITHDKKGQLFNTNADSIASKIAINLSENTIVKLFYCFEKKGVLKNLDDENSFIKKIDWNDYKKLKKNKNISEGMIPKLENCFYAMKNGVKHVRIGNNEIFSKKKYFTELKI